MAKPSRKSERIEPSSGNVFADLGLQNAAELDTKVRLLVLINQSTVSALTSYRIDKFSAERLMGFVTALGCDIEIRITRPRQLTSRPGRIVVVAP